MALILRFFFFFFFVTVLGCSSQQKDIFEEENEDNEEVMQTIFDSSNERVGAFRIGEIQEPEKAQKKEKAKEVKTPKKKNQQVEKKTESTSSKLSEVKPPEKSDEKQKHVSKLPVEEEIEIEKEGDEIYPEEFVDYDKRSKKLWESTNPIYYPGEKFVYDIKYLGITAAHIKISVGKVVEVAKRKAFHYKAVLKSARFYSAFYEMEDILESYVDAKDQVPLRYSLVQRETKKDVDDLQIFDRNEDKTYFFYKRVKEGEVKKEEKEAFIPSYFHDTFSAMFFVRGLPMNIGDVYEFPIITRAKLWLVKIKVNSVVEVKNQGEWVDAFKIEAETRFPDELSKERGSITFWVSTSKRRKLLRFSADVRFGSIYGDLVEYSPGGNPIEPEEL
jgi:hypothetical protein